MTPTHLGTGHGSTYLNARCLFCGRNTRRHSRRARTFTCSHCGEVNIGPGLARALAKLVNSEPALPPARRKKTPPAPSPEAVLTETVPLSSTPAAPPPRRPGHTTVKAAAAASPKAPVVSRPAAAVRKPKPAAKPAPHAPAKNGSKSLLERLAWG